MGNYENMNNKKLDEEIKKKSENIRKFESLEEFIDNISEKYSMYNNEKMVELVENIEEIIKSKDYITPDDICDYIKEDAMDVKKKSNISDEEFDEFFFELRNHIESQSDKITLKDDISEIIDRAFSKTIESFI